MFAPVTPNLVILVPKVSEYSDSCAKGLFCAPMLGSFLVNRRSVWVVVIGLEFLGLACPGLGLGSDYGYNIYAEVTLSLI
jgi:hypothetical protein